MPIPFFSVVIPSRDRPDLIAFALESLRRQTFEDFEVIVSDNPERRPCKEAFDRFADGRFQYIRPREPLPMHDNWNFALDRARAEYAIVLNDKSVLVPTALETAFQLLDREKPEIVSWWHEYFFPDDEGRGPEPGTLQFEPVAIPPVEYCPREDLRRRYQFAHRLGTDGILYFRGMIYFGAYHRGLIERVRRRLGRLFFPIAPDYTSMLAAQACCTRAFDLGRPLLLTMYTARSNGMRFLADPAAGLRFLLEIDPTGNILDDLPVPRLYASPHNVVAHDYKYVGELLPERMGDIELNFLNLLDRIQEDMEWRTWVDDETRKEQFQVWLDAISRLPFRYRRHLAWRQIRFRLGRWLFHLRKSVRSAVLTVPPLYRFLRALRRRVMSDGNSTIRFHGAFLEAAAILGSSIAPRSAKAAASSSGRLRF